MEKRTSDVANEEIVEWLHSRGDFLNLLGAAGIGAAAGTSMLPGTAEDAVRTRLQPTNFSFRTREHFRPFDLLAKNFVQLDDNFNRNTIGGYTVLRPGPPRKMMATSRRETASCVLLGWTTTTPSSSPIPESGRPT